MEDAETRGLLVVDEAVEDGDDVVDAEDEGVQDARAAELESAVEIVELRESEGDEAEEDHPGLPAVELVLAVDDCADEELDGGFREEEGVRGEDAAAGRWGC